MMLPIISLLTGISLLYYIRQKRAEKEMDEIVSSISPSNDSNENIDTRDLCLELLRQFNCEVRVEHDDILQSCIFCIRKKSLIIFCLSCNVC